MAGKVVHFDIPIDDPDRAVVFYNEVFDWGLQRWGQMDYWTTADRPGDGIGGALGRREEPAETVTIYIGVDDIDTTLAAIEAAGGRRLSERMPIPTVGWMALFADPEGNRIGLFQADPSVPVPGT
jgi:predicted enzyme related to lactoylglutathione lyase